MTRSPIRGLLVLALVSLLGAGCGEDILGPGALTLSDIEVYPTGAATDSLVVTVTATNTRNSVIEIPGCLVLDLGVHDASGALVWRRLSAATVFNDFCPDPPLLEPGETWEGSATWRLVNQAGAPVPPGEYTLVVDVVEVLVPEPRSVRGEPITVQVNNPDWEAGT